MLTLDFMERTEGDFCDGNTLHEPCQGNPKPCLSPQKNRAISILYVDDEISMLGITKLYLERSSDFTVETVDSAQNALEMLKDRQYDAIVSDYQMPAMNGITFLKTLRFRGDTTPFILFTGRGREEIVIEALNSGADFYLQKGGGPSSMFVELAHKLSLIVEQRRIKTELSESRRRLADIIEFLPDAAFAINSEGKVIAWNKAIEAMTGVPAADMLGKGDHEYAIPFYGERLPLLIDLILGPPEKMSEKYSNIVRDGDILSAENSLAHPRGIDLIFTGKASPLYNQKGEVIGAIESIHDITRQRKAEEKLRIAHKDLNAAYEQLTTTEEGAAPEL